MPKARIVSDGTSQGTTIFDENGKKIGLASRIEIVIDARVPSVSALMELIPVGLDVVAEARAVETMTSVRPSPIKRIFVCSPFGGSAENQELARGYARKVVAAGHAPFVPHLLYPQFLGDSLKLERYKGMQSGEAFLLACEEIWVFDENGISPGMKEEIEVAKKVGIPLVNGHTGRPWDE